MRHRLLVLGVAALVLIVSATLIGLLVVTNTDYGRERVRNIAQSAIQSAAKHGVVRLGRVSGNLLEGFTIANVSIRDSSGAPFIVADSVSLTYGLRALLLKRLELADVRLVRPLVVLDRPPGDSTVWNYKILGRYILPWEIGFAGSYKLQSGRQWGRSASVTLPVAGAEVIRMEPVTSNRTPNVSILDFRLDKGFSFGRYGKLTGMVDVFNLLNANPETTFRTATGASFLEVTSLLNPRIARVGLRYDF